MKTADKGLGQMKELAKNLRFDKVRVWRVETCQHQQ